MDLLVINILYLIIFALIIGYGVRFIPENILNPYNFLFRERKWEREGRLYDRVFRVKSWKKYLPEGGEFYKVNAFNKKYLSSTDPEYLKRFAIETARAELTHILLVLLFLPSIFWNTLQNVFYIFIFTFSVNLPFIIVQRYNRIRFLRILEEMGYPISDTFRR